MSKQLNFLRNSLLNKYKNWLKKKKTTQALTESIVKYDRVLETVLL